MSPYRRTNSNDDQTDELAELCLPLDAQRTIDIDLVALGQPYAEIVVGGPQPSSLLVVESEDHRVFSAGTTSILAQLLGWRRGRRQRVEIQEAGRIGTTASPIALTAKSSVCQCPRSSSGRRLRSASALT